jgi:hypothetical protein
MRLRWGIAGALRAAARCMVGVAVMMAAIPPAAAKDKRWDAERAEAIARQLAPVREAVVEDYLRGDPDRAWSRLRGAVDETDWLAVLALGDHAWAFDPAQSLQWHRRAAAMSGDDPHALVELALEYTRHEQCAEAVAAWQKIDKAGLLHSHLPMVAGYCYLKLGQDGAAFAMIDRSRSRHGGLEQLLQELWGKPIALAVHAERMQAFNQSGDAQALEAALANAIRFDMGADRGQALLAIADAATRAPHSDLAGPLACLRPVFASEAGKAAGADPGTQPAGERATTDRLRALWKAQTAQCKLSVDADPLPESAVLFEFLLVNALNLEIATYQDVLARQRDALDQRARSTGGDLKALHVLAALQDNLKDPALKDTDTLGWERYGAAEYAASRVRGEIVQGVLSEQGKVLLQRAYAQFPHDAGVLQLWLEYGAPERDAARQGWRELALLQFHTPSLQRENMHFTMVAMTLYLALQRYRELSE